MVIPHHAARWTSCLEAALVLCTVHANRTHSARRITLHPPVSVRVGASSLLAPLPSCACCGGFPHTLLQDSAALAQLQELHDLLSLEYERSQATPALRLLDEVLDLLGNDPYMPGGHDRGEAVVQRLRKAFTGGGGHGSVCVCCLNAARLPRVCLCLFKTQREYATWDATMPVWHLFAFWCCCMA